nr:hypothetical protein [Candidatus Sigynarchaeota archaeon]
MKMSKTWTFNGQTFKGGISKGRHIIWKFFKEGFGKGHHLHWKIWKNKPA